jgi:hypothetical protein
MKCPKCNVEMLDLLTEDLCPKCTKRLPLTIVCDGGVVYCGGGREEPCAETRLREFLEQLCVSFPHFSPPLSASTESAAVNPEKLTALIEAELQRLIMENCREAPSSKTSREMKESEA